MKKVIKFHGEDRNNNKTSKPNVDPLVLKYNELLAKIPQNKHTSLDMLNHEDIDLKDLFSYMVTTQDYFISKQ
jgi:hypothetical protein